MSFGRCAAGSSLYMAFAHAVHASYSWQIKRIWRERIGGLPGLGMPSGKKTSLNVSPAYDIVEEHCRSVETASEVKGGLLFVACSVDNCGDDE